MVLKIQQKCSKKGLCRAFLRRPQRNSWAFGSGEFFFSAPECDNDLGLCFPVHANLSPGGYFFMNNSDFFGPGGGEGGGGGRVPPFVRACSLELVGFRGASSEYDS